MSTLNNEVLNVSDVLLPIDKFPVIGKREILKEALEKMGQSRLGIACIVGEENSLLGILTDGDIRRKLLKVQKPFSAFFVDDALDHAIKSPITILPDDTLKNAIDLMEDKEVWDLPVVNEEGCLVGLLHLHKAIQKLLELDN